MTRQSGITLVELLMGAAITVIAVFALTSFLQSSSKETQALRSRSEQQSSYTLLSGGIQKTMSTSFRFMAKLGDTQGQARVIFPMLNRCRDLSFCPGATSLFYIAPERNDHKKWPVRAIKGAEPKFSIYYSSDYKSEIESELQVGDLITIFLAPFAPLYRVVSQPSVERTKLDGDLKEANYTRLDVQSFSLPTSFFKDASPYGLTSFDLSNRLGIGSFEVRFRIVGPRAVNRPETGATWDFATRTCAASPGGLKCDGIDGPTVFLHDLKSQQILGSFRRPLRSSGRCLSTDVLFDLASARESGLPTCDQASAATSAVRFDSPTQEPVPHVMTPSENPGDMDPRAFSLVKLENLSSIRFKLKLLRPMPNLPENAANSSQEMSFNVIFP